MTSGVGPSRYYLRANTMEPTTTPPIRTLVRASLLPGHDRPVPEGLMSGFFADYASLLLSVLQAADLQTVRWVVAIATSPRVSKPEQIRLTALVDEGATFDAVRQLARALVPVFQTMAVVPSITPVDVSTWSREVAQRGSHYLLVHRRGVLVYESPGEPH